MSSMRYVLTLGIPCTDHNNFRFSKRLRTNFADYDGLVEEIGRMIETGELRRMVEGMTDYHGGPEKMRAAWNEAYSRMLSGDAEKAK